jgi:hypothetical protein
MSFPTIRAPDKQTNADGGFVLGPDDGDAYHWLGSLTLKKVTRADTGGDLDIVDHRVPPPISRPCTSTATRTRSFSSSRASWT